MTFSMPISIFDLIVKHAPCAIMIPKISCVFLGPTFPLENEAFWRLRGHHIFPKIRFRPNLGLHDFSKEKSEGPRPLLRWLRHFFSSTPFFGEILIIPSWASLGIGLDLSTSKIPISGKSICGQGSIWAFASPADRGWPGLGFGTMRLWGFRGTQASRTYQALSASINFGCPCIGAL